jgi:DNA repair photolyase
VTRAEKEIFVEDPTPHYLVRSKKELHGWYRDARECTSERMLINPYNGCLNGCIYCYASSYAGYFKRFRDSGLPTVFRDFDRIVGSQLDSLDVAACGYLSPVTDPFQRLEETYHLSLGIVREFVKRNIPIEFITKSRVPSSVLDAISQQEDSFCQFSITTIDEEKRRMLMREGATTDELFELISRARRLGIHTVLRIDPVIPFVTDSENELKGLIARGCDHGASHIVASVMDVPIGLKSGLFDKLGRFGGRTELRLEKLYREKICGYMNADISYRRAIFELLRGECDRRGVTFALCMEFELVDDGPVGLNGEFASSTNCEGTDVPVYIRNGEKFRRAADCDGNCLKCKDAVCGIEDLAMGRSPSARKAFRMSDYRRWSRAARTRAAVSACQGSRGAKE